MLKPLLVSGLALSLGLTVLQGAGAAGRAAPRTVTPNTVQRSTMNAPTRPFAFEVEPAVYDPFKTYLAQSAWLPGIGCPTNSRLNTTGTASGTTSFTDPACPTGDPRGDKKNWGLLLAKTGPTGNYAAGVANIEANFRGVTITELGFDFRSGGNCGAGAPRFDVVDANNVDHFYGCTYGVVTSASPGWKRIRFYPGTASYPGDGGPLVNPIKAIQIVHDEGQDTGPTFSGLAILDNIDINRTLVGRPSSDNGNN